MSWKPMSNIQWLVVHCSDTKKDHHVDAADIRRWHMYDQHTQFDDIGYHYVIRRDGMIEKGRPENRPGAHCRGINHISLGICMVGGKGDDGEPEENFTRHQWTSLKELITELETRYPNAKVIGHGDVPGANKACPSFDVMAWYEFIFRRSQDHKKS